MQATAPSPAPRAADGPLPGRSAQGGSKGGSPQGGDGLLVTRADAASLDDARLAAWLDLHRAQEGVANPFCSPTWVLAWYRQYVPAERQVLLLVTDRDRLVGVVPLYLHEFALGRVPLARTRPLARRLVTVGAGVSTPMELPPLLSAPGRARAVTRAVVRWALRAGVDWTELCLAREQHGWLGAEQAGVTAGVAAFARFQQVRACVVLRLEPTWEQTRAGLGRNVKESVRRAVNRLAKDGREWRIVHRTGADLDRAAVERLLRLHAARSDYQGSWSAHHDAFAAPPTTAFMVDLVPRLGLAGEATLMELELAGEIAAVQLVLHPPGGVYVHSSGFVPDEWRLSPVTRLQVAAFEAATARGDRWVNLSPGPNEAKLRWSDRMAMFDDIAFGPATRRGLARYGAFFIAKDMRQLRHERATELRKIEAGVAG